MPIVPVQAGPRSERMSPNRFEATTTSNQSGCSTKCAVRMSMWYLSHVHVGIVLRHRLDPLVPVRHGDRDAVRLGRRGEVLLRPLLRELEGELQHAVDADARHHGLLHHELALGAGEHARRRSRNTRPRCSRARRRSRCRPACGPASGDGTPGISRTGRRLTYWSNSRRNWMQRAPQRDVVRHLRRPADGAEEDRVVRADLVLPVLRHHAAVLGVVVAGGEIELVLAQLEAELLGRGLEHAHALRHDLLADAVARG